jgi:hypothetical protein
LVLVIMVSFVPLYDVFYPLWWDGLEDGGYHDRIGRIKVVSQSTSQVASVLREKPKWLETEMSGSQRRRETVGQQRRRLETKPKTLESPCRTTLRRNQATSTGIGGGKKTTVVKSPPAAPVPAEFAAALPRHHYTPGIMRLMMRGLLGARAGQRSLAAVLRMVSSWLPGGAATPCANTARMWLLRLGLYELTRPRRKAEDWVWILDHTVQLGPHKALAIVGVRLGRWKQRPLRHGDVTVLDITPMLRSTGEIVESRLAAVAEKTGVPRAIVCDGGTDLRRGIADFQKTRPGIACLYDVKHKMALLLQRQLERDSRWVRFVGHVNQSRSRLALTNLACLIPPNLKAKARYMNLGPLTRWGRNVLAFLEEARVIPGQVVHRPTLEDKLGWLRDYREALYHWSVLLAIAETVENYVRHEGYHATAAEQLRTRLAGLAINASAMTMTEDALTFVAEQSSQARPGERLIGSSEVLESLFGKYKQMQGIHRQGGMTSQLLALGAAVGRQTVQTLRRAFATIHTRDVVQWCRQHLGLSLQSQRIYAFREQKLDTKPLTPLPSF